MDTKIYHGDIQAQEIAKALVNQFNRGNLMAKKAKSGEQFLVQIASRRDAKSGGQTALGVTIQQNDDGVTIKLGKQAWLGLIASLGQSLLYLRNPFNLLHRLDDIAQDIENLGLDDKIWEVIEDVAKTAGASHDLSEKLNRYVCEFCNTANPPGEGRCLACGAPLGDVQPITCQNCGFAANPGDTKCENCGKKL